MDEKSPGPLISGLACCSGQIFQAAQDTEDRAPGDFSKRVVLVAGYCATTGPAGAATCQNGSLGFNPRRSHILNKGPCLLQRPGFSSRSGRCAGRPWELFRTRPACRGLLCHPGWSGGSHVPIWQPWILDEKSWGRGCSARRRYSPGQGGAPAQEEMTKIHNIHSPTCHFTNYAGHDGKSPWAGAVTPGGVND